MDNLNQQINSIGAFNASMRKIEQALQDDKRQKIYEKSAKHAFDVIAGQIKHVESTLAADQEVLLMFASFGQAVTMAVERIGYKEPHFIFFSGKVGDQPAQLVQHMSQLSFLTIVAKIEMPRPARRIGFCYDQSQEE